MVAIDNDAAGNYSITECILSTSMSILKGSTYASNQDNPAFIKYISDIIEESVNPNIILGGDWNSTRNFSLLENINNKTQNNLHTTRPIGSL